MNNVARKLKSFLTFTLSVCLLASCTSGSDVKGELGNTYPLKTDEKLTWTTWTASHSDYFDYKQQPFFKGLIEQTGVDIDFNFNVKGESIYLMLESDELPDIIQYDWYNIEGGPDKMIDDGIILDLTPYIDKWAPNLKKYLDEHPDIARDLKTDKGRYYIFPFIRGDEKLTVFEGMMLRKDLLDKYNLQIPETIDEWEIVLKTMKDNGVEIPLSFSNINCKPITTAYNLTDSFYLNNGVVEYGPMQSRWKDYLTTMNRWYEMGLIDPDFGMVQNQMLIGKLSAGKVGATSATCGSVMGVALSSGKEKNSEFSLVGAKYPVLNKGDKPEFGTAETLYNSNSGTAITTQCDNIELAVKVLDYAYSEKGHLLYNFGIEGESYEMIDGKPTYKENIYNYDKGDITVSLKRYIMSIDHAPCVQDLGMYEQRLSYKEQKEAITTWSDSNMKEHILPHIALNEEEYAIMTEYWKKIDTYVRETTMDFITGKKSLDEFDGYVETLKNMGIEKVVAAKQSAYNRYVERE